MAKNQHYENMKDIEQMTVTVPDDAVFVGGILFFEDKDEFGKHVCPTLAINQSSDFAPTMLFIIHMVKAFMEAQNQAHDTMH